MHSSSYESFCEELWQGFLANETTYSPYVTNKFLTDYIPEPFVKYECGKEPLFVLLTNPGGGMVHQRRRSILSGQSCVNRRHSYAEAAIELGNKYLRQLRGKPAGARIKKMMTLAEKLGKSGVVQLECIPLHSKRLSGSARLVEGIERDAVLSKYTELLTSYLRDQSVIAVCATGGRDITPLAIKNSPWLTWVAGIAGLATQRIKFHTTVEKGGASTGALFSQSVRGKVKAIHAIIGSNSLPKESNSGAIYRALMQR
jgi:hypothetical protein